MPSASIENTTPFTTYSMTVTAKNDIGYGPESPPVEAQFNFNLAEGGNEQEFVTDAASVAALPQLFESAGEQWRYHEFLKDTADKTFTVLSNPRPFGVLIFAGGGGGGNNDWNAGGGGGGGYIEDYEFTIATGPHTLTIGSGGGNNTGTKGGNSVGFGLTAIGGGQGGNTVGGTAYPGGAGGSGGGGGGMNAGKGNRSGGAAEPGQGHNGGAGYNDTGTMVGGGGGGGGAGGGGSSAYGGGSGGPGKDFWITGVKVTAGAGGAGAREGTRVGGKGWSGIHGGIVIAYRIG